MFYYVCLKATRPFFYLTMVTVWIFFLFKSSMFPSGYYVVSMIPVSQSAFLFVVLFREYCHLLTQKFHGGIHPYYIKHKLLFPVYRIHSVVLQVSIFYLWLPVLFSSGLLSWPLF